MKLIAGAWPTMATPFDSRMQLDLGVYREMIEWYIAHGVGGLYANCLSSEMYALTPDERLTLAREAVSIAAGRVPVVATGNLGADINEHIDFCRRVSGAGVDAVMLVVPEFCPDDAALERYYLTLADQVAAPLGLYECPVPRPYHLGVELVRVLAHSGRFVAYKETSCDLAKIHALLGTVAGTPLTLMQANTPDLLDATRAGAPGTMSIASIWLPDLVAAVIRSAQAGDPAAESYHAQLCALEMVQRVVHPIGAKYLLSKRGVPIAATGRPDRTLAPEVLCALDWCARAWFDGAGNLLGL